LLVGGGRAERWSVTLAMGSCEKNIFFIF
jgi:hypothetical protein